MSDNADHVLFILKDIKQLNNLPDNFLSGNYKITELRNNDKEVIELIHECNLVVTDYDIHKISKTLLKEIKDKVIIHVTHKDSEIITCHLTSECIYSYKKSRTKSFVEIVEENITSWIQKSDERNNNKRILALLKSQTLKLNSQIGLQHNIQKELTEKEEIYRTIVEGTSNGFFRIDTKGNFMFVNKQAAKFLNKDLSMFANATLWDIFPKDIATEYSNSIKKSTKDNISISSSQTFEIYGRQFCTETTIYPVKDKDEKFTSVIGIVSNITHKFNAEVEKRKSGERIKSINTILENKIQELSATNDKLNHEIIERRKVEKALIKNEERFLQLAENIDEAFALVEDHKILYASKGFEKIWGVSVDLIYKDTNYWINSAHQEDIEKLKAFMVQIYKERKNASIEFRINHVSGEIKWIRAKIFPIFDKKTNKLRIASIATDITSNKTMEKKVQVSSIKAEERERKRFAKDLHDGLGPLLSSAKLCINLLTEDTAPEKRMEVSNKALEIINMAISNTKDISNNISPHILSNFGLISAINGYFKRINVDRQFKLILDTDMTDLRFNEDQEVVLYRVVEELIHNAFKHASANILELHINSINNQIRLEYNDNGVGFDTSIINDKTGKEMGMGLYNMKSRIQAINGSFMIESQRNKGVHVKITVSLL